MKRIGNKVLIVEDNRAINQMLTCTIREQLQIDVESAGSLIEAKEILERQHDQFFVAILDLNLPDAPDGEIVNLVLGFNIPPIILTGSVNNELHDQMVEKAIIDYVVKRNQYEYEYIIKTVQRLKENRNRKILIVDDSSSSRELLIELLTRHYFNVLTAKNGAEALDIISSQEGITLVIVDYHMPQSNGAEFIAQVREQYSRNELAIIGISTSESGYVSIDLLKSGANDFISKPFLHEEFYCRINQNIDVVSNYQKLRDIANRDFLTGLYNRGYMYKAGEKMLQKAARNNQLISVAIIDIDHFKKINDSYGHGIGDLALKNVAEMFRNQLRDIDIIARIGGEEFCVICATENAHIADKIFNRLCKKINDTPLMHEDGPITITVSIGYSTERRGSLSEFVNDADKALYEAKNTGRNKVVRFSTLTEPELAEC